MYNPDSCQDRPSTAWHASPGLPPATWPDEPLPTRDIEPIHVPDPELEHYHRPIGDPPYHCPQHPPFEPPPRPGSPAPVPAFR
ncbi:hypothetical protein [Chitinimonas lacunae]|uniref:Uncharacterized protein n=1 Tax=Chitinimonas lacunae TaxID=1963018 RepID=A0ABV8MM98_9NEIS